MSGTKPYPQELRQRAVRMVAEVRPNYESDWAAITEAVLFRDDHGPMLDIIAATDPILPASNTYDFPRGGLPHRLGHSDRHLDGGIAAAVSAHCSSPGSRTSFT